jgi:hypothetical protein
LASSSPSTFVLYRPGAGTWNLSETDSNFSHNMWWRGDGNFNSNRFDLEDGDYTLAEWNTLREVEGELGQNPNLINPDGSNFPSDFELSSESQAIDAGDWLTETTNSGTGTTFSVNFAGYFRQSFSVDSTEILHADNIFVGNNKNLEVSSVDYHNNQITVNRSITWSLNDEVSLSYYLGSSPDIGAFEYPGSGTAANPPNITNINFEESDPLDTNESFGWINITVTVTGYSSINSVKVDISGPSGSYNLSMSPLGSDNYYHNTSTVFSSSGDYNYFVWADDINGNSSTSNELAFSMPPNWDIDKNGVCNVFDFTLVSNLYNETGLTGWIRQDVDNNGIINILDLVVVAQHYAETW